MVYKALSSALEEQQNRYEDDIEKHISLYKMVI